MILTQLSVLICSYLWVGIYVYGSQAVWNIMASSPFYNNYKIQAATPFLPRYFSKELSLTSARMSCIWLCTLEKTCQALNFYDSGKAFVCERLAFNLCTQGFGSVTYIQGSSVWNKITNGQPKSCIDNYTVSNGTVIDCNKWRPGCQGTWPNCSNCIKTCSECYSRYNYTLNANTPQDRKLCTLWSITNLSAMSETFNCYGNYLEFMYQIAKNSDPRAIMPYLMPFSSMNRLCSLYPGGKLKFRFQDINNVEYSVVYKNAYIDENGTLWNMTFSHFDGKPLVDLFNLGNGTLQPTPFVKLKDGTNVCGSFWLLDVPKRNSCPGGNVSIFGRAQFSAANKLTSTGIQAPGTPAGVMFYFASVSFNF